MFVALAVITLLFRFWLAARVPFTPDEAYFYFWGVFPDYGYYEQPPMVGWWLAALLQLSPAAWVLRLPQTLGPVLMALSMIALSAPEDRAKAYAAASAFLACPAEVWNVLITTDTPLVLFSFACVALFLTALERDKWGYYAAAGVLYGCAFLSKYLAVPLALAFVVFALISPRAEGRIPGLLVMAAAAAPAGLLTLYWNYQHCWGNIVFNLINRNEGTGLSWRGPAEYAATLAYMFCPVALWHLWRRRAQARSWMVKPQTRLLLASVLVPAGVLGLISVDRDVGLHWLLSFVPFFYLALIRLLDEREIARSVTFQSALGGAHLALLTLAMLVPLGAWQNLAIYPKLVFHSRTKEVLREIEPYLDGPVLAGDGYSTAAVLGYYSGRYVPAFAPFGPHGRQDDLLVDVRDFDGRDIAIFNETPFQAKDYTKFFQSVETRTLQVAGADFYLALGHGFDYSAYKERVLRRQLARHYKIPAFLPQGHCYFCERYFSMDKCPTR